MVDAPNSKKSTNDKKGEGREIVVLDTCVLLADPDAIFAFDDCDVVLPLTVIEELDNHKTRLDDVGRAARQSVRHLERMRIEGGGDLRMPVACGHNSSVRIEINGLRLEELDKLGLPITKNDNRILAAALGLSRLATVRFVSADVNMRIKAASLGLVAEDWRHVQRRVAEKQGWVDSEVEATMIDKLYSDGEVDYDYSIDVAENEFVVLHSGNQSGLARRVGDQLIKLQKRRAWGLESRSKEQAFALNLLMDEKVQAVALTGPAGTGKTMVTLAAALEQTFERHAKYDRLMILRPVIAVGRQDIGFLPGDLQEKIGPWFEAIVDTMVALGENTSHEQARRTMDLWVEAGRLVMEPVTFLRGRSLQNTFVIVDEAQNLEPLTAKTILTRIGSGSKVVMLGDVEQIDNPYTSQDVNALSTTLSRLTDHPLFGHVHLTRGERSELAELAAERL